MDTLIAKGSFRLWKRLNAGCLLEERQRALFGWFLYKELLRLAGPNFAKGFLLRGGVEDTRLEAKDTKKIRGQGQGQPFRGQTL